MARIYCVSNQKGGVGKTTTSINLAASLASAEHRVLLIDLDPQANATSGLGVERTRASQTTYDVLIGGTSIADAVAPTALRFLDVVPSAPELTGAEIELVQVDRREFQLKDAIAAVARKYQYIVIDCPPSLGLLTLNALTAAHAVLVPLQCEYFALEGLTQLLNTVELVRQSLNPRLKVEGIVLTMFDARANISHQVAEEIRRTFHDLVFRTVIPRNVRLAESPSFGKPILLYDIQSKGCEAYLSLSRELVRREQRA